MNRFSKSTLDEELERIPLLHNVGRALVDLVHVLEPGDFRRTKGGWVYYPTNFLRLTVRYAKKRSIDLSLYQQYGKLWNRVHDPILPLGSGRYDSWFTCSVNSPRQLAAAAKYIEFSHRLRTGGGTGRA